MTFMTQMSLSSGEYALYDSLWVISRWAYVTEQNLQLFIRQKHIAENYQRMQEPLGF